MKTFPHRSLSTRLLRSLAPMIGAIALLAAHPAAHAQLGINPLACGMNLRPPGQYGPFDYRTVSPEIRHTVEDFHFTPGVESATQGATGVLGADLDYTLRAFPNNPRALMTVARLSKKLKTERPPGLRWPAECYYERAIRFAPDDPMPHVMYAHYLNERKRSAEVRAQLDEATRLRGDPSYFDLDYNIGLLYLDIGVYDKSLEAAKRAYALGAPLPALERKLKAAGKWVD